MAALTSPRAFRLSLLVTTLVVAAAAGSFLVVTTFISDDFLFLTFARLVRNPLIAFVMDQHGGEFYRPIPMTLWWLLARVGGGSTLPFAFTALALHALVAVELAALAGAAGETRAVRVLAALIFFLAPQCLDAAYWFSASTDLLATAALLGALIFLMRAGQRRWAWVASLLLAAVALLSKESALVLPVLALVMLSGRSSVGRRVLPHAVLAAAFVAVRWRVLHGWGGTSDVRASVSGKLLQLLSGLVHAGTGASAWPQPLAWGVGCVALVWMARHVVTDLRRPGPAAAWRPAAFVAVALLPLLGADWAVGARYFYLPAVGLAWLGARCLVDAPVAARALVLAAVVASSTVQGLQRRTSIVDFGRRISVAREAIIEGVTAGDTVFHIAAGIKDLDLAVKQSADVRRTVGPGGLLVLSDVPASFVLLPPVLAEPAKFLLASPPIPPSGGYRFGHANVVGLARRGDDPDLQEVVRRFPTIRFLRLRSDASGGVAAVDVTETIQHEIRPP